MAKTELQLMVERINAKPQKQRRKIDISDTPYERLKELNELLMEQFHTTDISLSETAEIAISSTLNEMRKEEKNG